jgi:hypothetical protein
MADHDGTATLTRADRAGVIGAAERGVRDALTQELFGDRDQGDGGSMLRDAAIVLHRARTAPERGPARERLLERSVNITSSDVAGTMGPATVALAENLAGGAAAVLEAVTVPLTPGHRPSVPALGGFPAWAGPQVGEKTEVPSTGVDVDGTTLLPELVSEVVNASWQVVTSAGDEIEAVLGARALVHALAYVHSEITSGAATATDLAGAVAAVEAAGFPPSYAFGSAGAYLEAGGDPTADRVAGLPLHLGGLGLPLAVVASVGVYAGRSESFDIRVAEPSLGGFEISIGHWLAVSAEPGAVAVVSGAAAAARTRKAK